MHCSGRVIPKRLLTTFLSDRWVFEIDGIKEGSYIFNPLYFSGEEYCGTPEEIEICVRRLYEKRFGEQYDPCSPTPTRVVPFFGMIEYLGGGGTVGEINLFTDEVKYLKTLMEKDDYGVPLRAKRLSANEYEELLQENEETIECHNSVETETMEQDDEYEMD